jgi:hypothetical protein
MAGVSNTCWTVQPGDAMARYGETEKEREEAEEEEEEELVNHIEEEEEEDQKNNIPDIPSLLNLGGLANDYFSQYSADRKTGGERRAGVGKQQPLRLLDSPLVGDQLLQAIQLCGSPYFSQLAALQHHHHHQQQNSADKGTSFTGTFTSFATTGGSEGCPTSPDLKGGFLGSAPVRRYKQYTEDSLQAALKEIMAGQSINRSSMKHNIPARTLRDWMKRLNIKSMYTHQHHHSSKGGGDKDGGGSVGSCSPEPELSVHLSEAGYPAAYAAMFPSLLRAAAAAHRADIELEEEEEMEEEEEEEEENLKIDESCPDSFQKIAQPAV